MAERIKDQSDWRDRIWKLYGLRASREIRAKVKNSKFTVKQLAYENAVPIMDHCALSTRKNWLSAICAELIQQGKLERIGQTYKFKGK